MKILVTGANGYIGQGVVKTLLDAGHEVLAVDINDSNIDKRAKIYCVDFFQIEDPYNYFENPDVLLYLAWRDGFSHNSPSHMEDLAKHYSFISGMVRNGLKRVVALGSMHEVGFWEGKIDENSPCNPMSLYGVSKNALRQALVNLQRECDYTLQWIRGYYIVGNSEHGCSIFSKITQAAKRGDKEFPFTSGVNQYDFIDYDKFCQQIVAVCEQTKVVGIINCCTGAPMRLGERVEQFIKDQGYDISLKYGTFPDRPYDSAAVWGDNRLITEIMESRNS